MLWCASPLRKSSNRLLSSVFRPLAKPSREVMSRLEEQCLAECFCPNHSPDCMLMMHITFQYLKGAAEITYKCLRPPRMPLHGQQWAAVHAGAHSWAQNAVYVRSCMFFM